MIHFIIDYIIEVLFIDFSENKDNPKLYLFTVESTIQK